MNAVNGIRVLEEVSLNALPALQQVHLDGWVLRFSNGYTGRGNSVNPLYPGMQDVHAKVEECERLYKSRSIPCIFKMTSAAHPTELDRVLEQRGYAEFNRTSVQCLPLGEYTALATGPNVIVSHQPTDEWMAAFAALREIPSQHAKTLRAMLADMVLPARYVLMLNDSAPAACGLAVAEGGYVGLFDITTHPRHRRRGLGTELVHALLNWGKGRGSTTAYLQVMATNVPAVALYKKLGFAERYQYWYRKAP